MSVSGKPGHSSMPKASTNSITILSKLIDSVHRNPTPNSLRSGIIAETVSFLAPHAPFLPRVILSNLWFFDWILTQFISDIPILNSFTRTTITPTEISGGIGKNVIPSSASANLNVRFVAKFYPQNSPW